MVGLNWNDAFIEGNKLGLGFGSYSSYATATSSICFAIHRSSL
jgi:hypothetical protein